jgi:hypothetical protein
MKFKKDRTDRFTGMPPSADRRVIHIRERNIRMQMNAVSLQNPLALLGYDSEDIPRRGQFGAVLARAGVGKTAFLVQLALMSMLKGKNLLHISLDNPVTKVSLWYEEVFRHLIRHHRLNQSDLLWEDLIRRRFIMTFRVEGFSVPKLQERLTDLTEQRIFAPRLIIIDGLPFDDAVRATLVDLKTLASNHGIGVWFAVRTHRHEDPGPDGIPVQLAAVSDLFECAIQLVPVGKEVYVKALKGAGEAASRPDLRLDPATLLVIDGDESAVSSG